MNYDELKEIVTRHCFVIDKYDYNWYSGNISLYIHANNTMFDETGCNDVLATAIFGNSHNCLRILWFDKLNVSKKLLRFSEVKKGVDWDSKDLAQIWDIQTGEQISRLQFTARQQIFSAVRFSPDGRYLATGAPSRKLAIWDVQTGQELQQWQVSVKPNSRPASAVVHAVAFLSNNQLISESSSGMAEVWEIKHE